MGVSTIQLFSDGLGKWTNYSIILPDAGEGPFPVLFQLHGLSDDHQAWIQRSNLVRHVAKLPLIVVLPDGGTSGYLNWKASNRLHKNHFEDLIVNDITNHLKRNFNVTSGQWAIGGLSMGGFGAMRLGLKYADRFASIWAHSSAFHIGDRADPALIEPESLATSNVFELANQVASDQSQPVISFDCGTEDELIDGNRELHAHMQSIGLNHTYNEHPGAHNCTYEPRALPLLVWTASEIERLAA